MISELLKGNISQEEYFQNYDISLVITNLPRKVYGFVFNYKDTNFIVINSSSSDDLKKEALLHEMAHIELFHLSKRKKLLEFKIDGLEDEADEYIKKAKEELIYE